MTTDMDESRCPLCGKPNHCVMAGCQKDPDKPCWCRHESFPQALLEQLPEAAKHRACICKHCIKEALNNYIRVVIQHTKEKV